jgi:hypothetical protein
MIIAWLIICTEVVGDLLKQYDRFLILSCFAQKSTHYYCGNICADVADGKPFAVFNSLAVSASSKLSSVFDVDIFVVKEKRCRS